MVAIFCALHSQNSRRPRARQPVNRRWIATHGCARLGWLCLSNQASRRSDRRFLPGESFDVLAWLNHGTRRRWLSLSGRARGARRNVEAWEGIGRDKLFRGRGVNRDSQHRLENAWVAIRSCFMFCASRTEAATVLRAFVPLPQRASLLRRCRSCTRGGKIWHATLRLQRGDNSGSLHPTV